MLCVTRETRFGLAMQRKRGHDEYPNSPMKPVATFTVSRDDSIYEAWPDLLLTPSGRLICLFWEGTFHTDRRYSRVMLTESDDRGRDLDAETPVERPRQRLGCAAAVAARRRAHRGHRQPLRGGTGGREAAAGIRLVLGGPGCDLGRPTRVARAGLRSRQAAGTTLRSLDRELPVLQSAGELLGSSGCGTPTTGGGRGTVR